MREGLDYKNTWRGMDETYANKALKFHHLRPLHPASSPSTTMAAMRSMIPNAQILVVDGAGWEGCGVVGVMNQPEVLCGW